jgi:hypothetical protein
MRASNVSRPLSSSDSEEMSPAVDVVALRNGFMRYQIKNRASAKPATQKQSSSLRARASAVALGGHARTVELPGQ